MSTNLEVAWHVRRQFFSILCDLVVQVYGGCVLQEAVLLVDSLHHLRVTVTNTDCDNASKCLQHKERSHAAVIVMPGQYIRGLKAPNHLPSHGAASLLSIKGIPALNQATSFISVPTQVHVWMVHVTSCTTWNPHGQYKVHVLHTTSFRTTVVTTLNLHQGTSCLFHHTSTASCPL